VGRVCSTTEEKRNVYRIFVGKRKGKRPLGRLSRRWEDNINMYLRDVGWGEMDWIDLAQDRDLRKALVNTEMSLRGSIQCWVILE
jgi:hypothetical protein